MSVINTLHLLLPFSLPTRAMTPTAAEPQRLFAFSRLMAPAQQVEYVRTAAFARTLPHQRWLARHFGVIEDHGVDRAPFAPYMQLADWVETGIPVSQCIADLRDSDWACIEPVSLRVAHDHLVLNEPVQLALSSDEARQLLEVARAVITPLDFALEAPGPLRWYVNDPTLTMLMCASPQAAVGRNVDIWLPVCADTGEHSLTWMKLQNEVQMAWFDHPVNCAREARGLPPVNSIWLHACGHLKPIQCAFSHVYSSQVATRGLAFAAHAEAKSPPIGFNLLSALHADVLVELDALGQSFITRDWLAWWAAWTALEHNWFAPALAALKSGALRALTLTLTGETKIVTLTVTRADLYKFWRRRQWNTLL